MNECRRGLCSAWQNCASLTFVVFYLSRQQSVYSRLPLPVVKKSCSAWQHCDSLTVDVFS